MPGLSAYRVAMDIHVPPNRMSQIVHERRDMTPDTVLRLAQYFDMSAAFWINLQGLYDLEIAKGALESKIRREVKPCKRPPPCKGAPPKALIYGFCGLIFRSR